METAMSQDARMDPLIQQMARDAREAGVVVDEAYAEQRLRQARLRPLMADLQAADEAVDTAIGAGAYQAAVVALGLAARAFLKELRAQS